MAPSPLLSLHAVSKSFGLTRALADVDLSLQAGEAVALMGANGAGKSTLVKILCGLQAPDSGLIRIAGKDVRLASSTDATAAGIVAVHQSITEVGVPDLSVAENLVLDLLCSGRFPVFASGKSIDRVAASRAETVGLHVDPRLRWSQIQPADRQLIAIARALAHEPRILILDEPTASLSEQEAARVFAVVERLKGDGVAILFVSHKTSDLKRLADRAVVLRDGRMAGGFQAPVDYAAAIRLMVGRDVMSRLPRPARTGAATVLSVKGLQVRPSAAPSDLDIREGEIVAITGPVGSGKSTLAGALFGLWPLAGGSIALDGRPFLPRGPAAAIEAGVFLAGEDRWRSSFFPDTVPFAGIAGTIGFPFLKRWSTSGLLPLARERRAAQDAIAAFGIKAKGPADRLTALSGGNQQKVVLARWHAEPARLLLLDEPFQGVDIGARNDIIGAIRDRSGDRATLVFVNDYEEALEVGDRIFAMEDGTLAPVRGEAFRPAAPSATLPVTSPKAVP